MIPQYNGATYQVFLSLFAISGIPGLEGCDTGVVFVLALDNRFALGTVYLGGATSTLRGGSLPVGIDSHLPATAERSRLGIVYVHIGGVPASDEGRPLQPVFTRHPDSFGFKIINSFL